MRTDRADRRFERHLVRLGVEAGLTDVAAVSDDDLVALPAPARRYLRFMGAVGRRRDWSFRIRFVGAFRMTPGRSWMPFSMIQYNCVEPVTRVADMRIDAAGFVPMFGTDSYITGQGRMHGRLLGLVTVADGTGSEFDQSELVTWVNDAVMVAPSLLLTPRTAWRAVDDGCCDLAVTDGGTTVSARIFVDARGRLTDFRTDDRWYSGGRRPLRTRWTTPVTEWSGDPCRPLPMASCAVWHLPAGEFAYIRGRFLPDTAVFNGPPSGPPARLSTDARHDTSGGLSPTDTSRGT